MLGPSLCVLASKDFRLLMMIMIIVFAVFALTFVSTYFAFLVALTVSLEALGIFAIAAFLNAELALLRLEVTSQHVIALRILAI
jgi:hypothetical protein